MFYENYGEIYNYLYSAEGEVRKPRQRGYRFSRLSFRITFIGKGACNDT